MAAEKFMHRTCASLLQNRSVLSTPMLPNLCACLRERHYSLECGRIKLPEGGRVFQWIPKSEPWPGPLTSTVPTRPTGESGGGGLKGWTAVDLRMGLQPRA